VKISELSSRSGVPVATVKFYLREGLLAGGEKSSQTQASYDASHLSRLRLIPDHRSSPGELAADLELSSGAMTSRLDRLEEQGFVRRLSDPKDRRGVVIELTPEGRAAWDRTAGVAGRREAFFASALTKDEQRQLNTLLRKLMLAFEATEPAGDGEK